MCICVCELFPCQTLNCQLVLACLLVPPFDLVCRATCEMVMVVLVLVLVVVVVVMVVVV